MRRMHPATKAAFVVIVFFGAIIVWLIWWVSQPSEPGFATRPTAAASAGWAHQGSTGALAR